MPYGDRTGPFGLGPRTGRASGYCAGYTAPGYMNPMPGQGFGFGIGRGGRGRRNWFYATGLTRWLRAAYGYPYRGAGDANLPVPLTVTREQELDMLKSQAEHLEKTLADMNQRMQELESEKKKKA